MAVLRYLVVAAVVAACLVAPPKARAQFKPPRISIPKPVDDALKGLDRKRLDAMEGTKYTFTIRNPNRNGVHFRVNGKPYLVSGGHRITITGRGTPRVTFDYGLGNGSYRSYDLRSGRTYVFKWSPASLAAPHDSVRSLLDLHQE